MPADIDLDWAATTTKESVASPRDDTSLWHADPGAPCRLLELPYEVRAQIYTYLVTTGFRIEFYDGGIISKDLHSSMGMLLTCKTICEEMLYLLYGRNQYVIQVTDERWKALRIIGERNLQRIRRAAIILEPTLHICYYGSAFYYRPLELDPLFWRPFLQDLKSLIIVIRAPRLYERSYDPLPPGEIEHEEGFDEYMGRLLKFLAEHLRERSERQELMISVDMNGDKQSQHIVWKYFNCHHCRVDTVVGDRIFDRTRKSTLTSTWRVRSCRFTMVVLARLKKGMGCCSGGGVNVTAVFCLNRSSLQCMSCENAHGRSLGSRSECTAARS